MQWVKIYTDMPHSKVSDVSVHSQLLFIYLILKSDKYGRYYADVSVVKALLLNMILDFDCAKIEECFMELHQHNHINLYEVRGVRYLEIRNYNKYQTADLSRIGATNIPAPNGSVPKSNKPKNVEKKQQEPVKVKAKSVKIDKPKFDFESAWDLYPNKMGKKKAMRHFNAQIKTQQDYENLLKAIDNYKIYIIKTGKQDYMQNGSTFFNSNWEDYVDMQVKQDIAGRSIGAKMTSHYILKDDIARKEIEIEEAIEKKENGAKIDMQPLYEQLQELKSQLNKEM